MTGRSILIWLAQPHILLNGRAQFDTALLKIGEAGEEWLTTAQTLSQDQEGQTGRPAAARPQPGNVVAFQGRRPAVDTTRVCPVRRLAIRPSASGA